MERRLAVVTGANGFVGRNLCPVLEGAGWQVRRVVRALSNKSDSSSAVAVGDLSRSAQWSEALAGADVVVHLAGRAHVPSRGESDAFFRVNVDATLQLAAAAERVGVRRFLFVSSAKVMGDGSPRGHAFSEEDEPRPVDAYAQSKLQAERRLRAAAGRMQLVILRPPLIYGPHVGANFLQLMRLIDRGVWLPLGAVRNRRSLVFVGNFAAAVAHCLNHADASGQTFFVSDGEDVSTQDLVRRIADALDRRARCAPVPPVLLRMLASAVGRRHDAERLLDDFAVDTRLIRERMGWQPPYTVDQGLTTTAGWYRTVSA